jgi:DNA polymerase III gamma/tau subunit/predicted DNA-binding transcriptional regulator AlpA
MQLVEKYRPRSLDSFTGLARPRAVMNHFLQQPYNSAWLFSGPSGQGKTTLAIALAEKLGGELHHIPSRSCDLATVEEVVNRCHYVPWVGQWHVVLVDEADQMSKAAQHAFLSKLDCAAPPPNTIFIFTANSDALLEDRFLSRCRRITFEPPSVDELIEFLSHVAELEHAPSAIDFTAIVAESKSNIRECLMRLEIDLIAGPAPKKVAPVTPAPEACPAKSNEGAGPIARNNSDAIDAPALASALRIHQATVYNWVKRGRLPQPRRIGCSMRWDRAQLAAAGVAI